MRFISWNVNGIRAILQKDFVNIVKKLNPDIICVQETKMQEGQAKVDLQEYEEYWNSALRKGYSGTAIFTKVQPIKVQYGIGKEEHDQEGRVITLEFDKFYLVNVYTPNSGRELLRLDYRMIWEDEFKKYLKELDKIKPVIICGDLNVAHKEIDLKNPKTNRNNAGFTDEERGKISNLLDNGFTDTYRYKYPDKENAYTWWSYMAHAREKNVGWRIDYFLISNRIKNSIQDAKIYDKIMGSDHCPIELEIGEI